MMSFPTIFEWLERFGSWRGVPAVYLVLATAVVVLVAWDWRVMLLALAAQYLMTGLLFVDVLDPRLAVIKVLTGWFVCLILYMTARQVNWGRLPTDILPEERAQLAQEKRLRVGRLSIPATMPLRLFLVAVMLIVVLTIDQRPAYHFLAVEAELDYLNLAVYTLVGMGLLGASLTTDPLQAGIGLFMFLAGFELFYSVLEQSLAMLAALSAVNLILALVIAYLTQAAYKFTAIFDV